ncbi:uncharacterized protein LOC118147193 [Callithrix jacchus]|uniref:uncharacterized protein LOC118147193 n=1 Tax=Callithrix jacchus TaxID=9483 RepID=UPI0023DD234A|nr:uncharacterized protein LOC118147193 [Callithrix jacchus]
MLQACSDAVGDLQGQFHHCLGMDTHNITDRSDHMTANCHWVHHITNTSSSTWLRQPLPGFCLALGLLSWGPARHEPSGHYHRSRSWLTSKLRPKSSTMRPVLFLLQQLQSSDVLLCHGIQGWLNEHHVQCTGDGCCGQAACDQLQSLDVAVLQPFLIIITFFMCVGITVENSTSARSTRRLTRHCSTWRRSTRVSGHLRRAWATKLWPLCLGLTPAS